jgi:HEAT repeat protein
MSSLFPEVRRLSLKELESFFQGTRTPHVPEDEQELWLQEVAIRIARTGAKGVDFLLSFLPRADQRRLRAALIALSFVQRTLSARKRMKICRLVMALLHDRRAMIVAEAVDTLSHLGCPAAEEEVYSLLQHGSPYVVGSALRFLSRHLGAKAAPLLVQALRSEEPIVRQNALDELDEMNYVRALPQIRQLLQDPDADVRQAARTAVGHFEHDSHRE